MRKARIKKEQKEASLATGGEGAAAAAATANDPEHLEEHRHGHDDGIDNWKTINPP